MAIQDGLARIITMPRGYTLLGLTTAGLAALLAQLYTKRRVVRRLKKRGIVSVAPLSAYPVILRGPN